VRQKSIPIRREGAPGARAHDFGGLPVDAIKAIDDAHRQLQERPKYDKR